MNDDSIDAMRYYVEQNFGNTIHKELKVESFKEPEYRSIIKIGNHFTIYNDHHFNWLNKFMFKLFFGLTIEDFKGVKDNE